MNFRMPYFRSCRIHVQDVGACITELYLLDMVINSETWNALYINIIGKAEERNFASIVRTFHCLKGIYKISLPDVRNYFAHLQSAADTIDSPCL